MPEDLIKIYGYIITGKNGDDYIDRSIKSLWNTVRQMLKKIFHRIWQEVDLFQDMIFKSARLTEDAKQSQLQAVPKRKKESKFKTFTITYLYMVKCYYEDNLARLLKMFFHIYSFIISCVCLDIIFLGNFSQRIEYSRASLLQTCNNPNSTIIRNKNKRE